MRPTLLLIALAAVVACGDDDSSSASTAPPSPTTAAATTSAGATTTAVVTDPTSAETTAETTAVAPDVDPVVAFTEIGTADNPTDLAWRAGDPGLYVVEQRGTIRPEYAVARGAAEGFYARLRQLFQEKRCITTFGPYSPGQAVAMTGMRNPSAAARANSPSCSRVCQIGSGSMPVYTGRIAAPTTKPIPIPNRAPSNAISAPTSNGRTASWRGDAPSAMPIPISRRCASTILLARLNAPNAAPATMSKANTFQNFWSLSMSS